MERVRVRIRRGALRELRTSPEAQAEILGRAQKIAGAAGGEQVGFFARATESPRNRARAAVIAASMRARRRNARDNTILRNIDAGRT